MFRPRVIPTLLLKNKGLVKTIGFKDSRYIGDPINAVRIFNEKEADELIFLDIMASRKQGFFSKKRDNSIPFDLIAKISKECLMPLTYGGGIKTIEDIKALFNIGVEKVAINTNAIKNPKLVKKASEIFGSQSIIVSIDAKLTNFGKYEAYTNGGSVPTGIDPIELAQKMVSIGAGEICINSIDKDGTMSGYDLDLIKNVADSVSVPVIACGGAGQLNDLRDAYLKGNASALAAGSLFVFHGRKRAVLINYPKRDEFEQVFKIN